MSHLQPVDYRAWPAVPIYDQADEHGRSVVLDEGDARFLTDELARGLPYSAHAIQATEVRDRILRQLRRPPH